MFEKIIRKFINPPFWVLKWRAVGNYSGESGEEALLSDPKDREAAQIEAQNKIDKMHPIFYRGETCTYVFNIHIRPWYLRLKFWS